MTTRAGVAGDEASLAIRFGEIVTAALPDWRVVIPAEATPSSWVWAEPSDGPALPDQGWKLHVSASILTAQAVLEAILPVLGHHRVAFKVVPHGGALARLNGGFDGPTQVGKFVTAYPADDAAAVDLARGLDAAIPPGLTGPVVPTDRPLREGSLVHYRYGAFSTARVQTPLGQPLLAMTDPDGSLVPDRRGLHYTRPEWVDDPFEAAGLTVEPASTSILDSRYLLLLPLARGARGSVHLAVDLHAGRQVVVKQARAGAVAGTDGADALERLGVEAAVLSELPTGSGAPAFVGQGPAPGGGYVAMEAIDGITLAHHLHDGRVRGERLPAATVRRWALDVAWTVHHVHAGGRAYRDLKLANVMIEDGEDGTGVDGRARLIDHELALALGTTITPSAAGTRGYRPPILVDRPVSEQDDVYALGALLWGMVTGVDPSYVPDPSDLRRLPAALLHPGHDRALAALAERCTAPDPADRPATMTAVIAELEAWGPQPAAGRPIDGAAPDHLALATRAGEALLAAAERHDGHTVWRSHRREAGGLVSRPLYEGVAGIVMALAQLHVEDLLDTEAALVGACRWLLDRSDGVTAVPGLFSGEMGVAVALATAGRALDDDRLQRAGTDIARGLGTRTRASGSTRAAADIGPDYVLGDAGLVRGHLLLADLTGDRTAVDAARAAGERVVEAAVDHPGGGCSWALPADLPSLGGRHCYGYGHGAAGVADVLLDLHATTGEGRWRAVAERALDWVAAGAVVRGDDRDALDWPEHADAPPIGGYWCHGAGGIAVVMARAGRLDIATAAGRMVARNTTAPPSRCHGLAGNVEILHALAPVVEDPEIVDGLDVQGRLLAAWHLGDGRWPAEVPDTTTPDYMVGWSGVIPALLRLAGRPSADRTLIGAPLAATLSA